MSWFKPIRVAIILAIVPTTLAAQSKELMDAYRKVLVLKKAGQYKHTEPYNRKAWRLERIKID